MLIAGAFGISTSESILRNTYWSKVRIEDATAYIGPAALIRETGNKTTTQAWSDIDCSAAFDPDQCQDCSDAAQGTITTAVVGVVTTIPTIQTDFQRSTQRGDLNCQKFMALFTGLAGGLSSMATLLAFSQNCWRVSGYDTEPGPGWTLQMIGTILKFLDIIFHLMLPTPPTIRYIKEHRMNRKDDQFTRASG